MITTDDSKFLRLAIDKAKESVSKGGFPSGAVIVKDQMIIGEGISIGNILRDPTSHGEMAAIRSACIHLQSSDLSGAVLYTCLCPCLMCLGAILWSGISRVTFACSQRTISAEYYGGNYDSQQINSLFLKPMELMHIADFEKETLAIIRAWEKKMEVP